MTKFIFNFITPLGRHLQKKDTSTDSFPSLKSPLLPMLVVIILS